MRDIFDILKKLPETIFLKSRINLCLFLGWKSIFLFLVCIEYNMGVRQTKEPVRDVNLPTWSNNDPRLFTMIQMQVARHVYKVNVAE